MSKLGQICVWHGAGRDKNITTSGLLMPGANGWVFVSSGDGSLRNGNLDLHVTIGMDAKPEAAVVTF